MSEVTELARQVEVERARLDASLSALQRRMSPAGLADETLAFVGRAKPEVVPEIRRMARANPLGMLLVGLGIGLIMWRGAGSRSAQLHRDPRRPLPRHPHRSNAHDT